MRFRNCQRKHSKDNQSNLGVNWDAELDEGKHADVHEDALDQQRRLVVLPEPEDDPDFFLN